MTFECVEEFVYEEYVANGYNTTACGHSTASIFFITYLIFVKLIFLNLFIAVILEGFEDTVNSENKVFNKEKAQHFTEVWSLFDEEGTGMITITDFKDFMFALGYPLGWDETFKNNKEKQDDFISELCLPTYNNFRHFYFLDVMEAISMHLLITKNILEKIEQAKMAGALLDQEQLEKDVKYLIKGDLEDMRNNDDNILALNAISARTEVREKKNK